MHKLQNVACYGKMSAVRTTICEMNFNAYFSGHGTPTNTNLNVIPGGGVFEVIYGAQHI